MPCSRPKSCQRFSIYIQLQALPASREHREGQALKLCHKCQCCISTAIQGIHLENLLDGDNLGKKLRSYKLIWHLSIHKTRIIIEQNKEFGEQMKIIQIPAVKQLVNISIMLIQALSKTCWRIFKESFPATGPLCCSYQSATISQKFQRMLQPCLLPSGAQHDKLNPIADYHISSTQAFRYFWH